MDSSSREPAWLSRECYRPVTQSRLGAPPRHLLAPLPAPAACLCLVPRAVCSTGRRPACFLLTCLLNRRAGGTVNQLMNVPPSDVGLPPQVSSLFLRTWPSLSVSSQPIQRISPKNLAPYFKPLPNGLFAGTYPCHAAMQHTRCLLCSCYAKALTVASDLCKGKTDGGRQGASMRRVVGGCADGEDEQGRTRSYLPCSTRCRRPRQTTRVGRRRKDQLPAAGPRVQRVQPAPQPSPKPSALPTSMPCWYCPPNRCIRCSPGAPCTSDTWQAGFSDTTRQA